MKEEAESRGRAMAARGDRGEMETICAATSGFRAADRVPDKRSRAAGRPIGVARIGATSAMARECGGGSRTGTRACKIAKTAGEGRGWGTVRWRRPPAKVPADAAAAAAAGAREGGRREMEGGVAHSDVCAARESLRFAGEGLSFSLMRRCVIVEMQGNPQKMKELCAWFDQTSVGNG